MPKYKIRYVARYKNPGGIYEEHFDDLEKLKMVIRCYDVVEIYKEKYRREVFNLDDGVIKPSKPVKKNI